jgi:RHS repeat-associated protein
MEHSKLTGGTADSVPKGQPRVASKSAKIEVPDTGNAKIDAMGDVLNKALSPFQNAPPPEQGAIGVVNQAVGAVMGLQNVGMELMNTGFAMATASIAAMMPAFPAAYLTVPHIGIPHAHSHPPSLVPPAPPVPLPSIGTLMLAGSVGVLIAGMPAGRCGDLGLAVTCGSLAPAFDVFLGSSNTFIAGNRAARMTDMTRHCNPASAALAVSRGAALFNAAVGALGAVSEAVGGGPVMGSVLQIAADLAAAAMSALLGKDPGLPPSMGALMLGAPTVLIGGFPCPNLPNPLDALMHGLKCLGKAFMKSKALGKLLKKVGLCNSPGEPINPFSGEVYNDFEDYHATDTAFVWERHYRSGWNEEDGPLGYGFRHFYQRTLTFYRTRVVYETHDNEVIALPTNADGSYGVTDGFTLTSSGGRNFELYTDRDETLTFELQNTTPLSARLTRYKTAKADVFLFYDSAGRLYALTESPMGAPIDSRISYDAAGHIVQVARGPRGGNPTTISRYAYHDGCMVEWHDALGATARFRYDGAHRMVQGTDRRGYSFHWQYDPQSGRCIKAGGDDNLWGVVAKYEGTTSTFTEPDDGVWTYKHYPDGVISHVVDPTGGIKQYVKDDSGRIIKQITPGGAEYLWVYSESGRLVGRRDPWGRLIPTEDEEPNPRSPLEHDGPLTQRGWLLGRPIASLRRPLRSLPSNILTALSSSGEGSPNAAPTSVEDPLGRLVARQHPNGANERWVRDGEGNATAHSDANGNWEQFRISSWNLTSAHRSALGYVTLFEHNHREMVVAVVDANGNRTNYVRDSLQRIRKVERHGEVYRDYQFDASDALIEERDKHGRMLVKRTIGPTGLTLKTVLASGEAYTYAYNGRGKYIEASSSVHRVTQQHGFAGRVLDQRDDLGVSHSYDRLGRLQRTTYFDRFNVEYAREASGVVAIRTSDGSQHCVWVNAAGHVVRENGNGTNEATAFDSAERLCARVCWRSSTLGSQRWTTRYEYNGCGELLQINDSELGTTSLVYDADHRLQVQEDRAGRRDYRYDPAGNLAYAPLHLTIQSGPGNLVRLSHHETFEYDERYRLSKRVQPYLNRTITYHYDSKDQLIEVRWSDRSETWRAGYDGLGRRLYTQYGDKRSELYWDGDRLAAEVDPDGKLRLYAYLNQDALVPFCFIDYASLQAAPQSGRIYYLFSAPNGMPVRVEDIRGAVVWKPQTVDAYGHLAPEPASTIDLRLRFAGHFYDPHTELFYNHYRDYDPKLARYLQPDPIGHAGSINLYSYPASPFVDVDLRGLVHSKKATEEHKGASGEPHEEAPRKTSEEHGKEWGVDPETGKAITPHTPSEQEKARRERYEKRCAEEGREPMGEEAWRESGYRANNNRDTSHPEEGRALAAVGAKNNNGPNAETHEYNEYHDKNGRSLGSTKDEDGNPRPPPAGAVDEDGNPRVRNADTRPDGIRDNDVVEHKHISGDDGGTLDDSPQMRAQRDMANDKGGDHEVVMTSDAPRDDVRPSSGLADNSTVKHVGPPPDSKVSTWKDGAWTP